MVMLWLQNLFYHDRILQRNNRKMTMKMVIFLLLIFHKIVPL